MKLTKALLKQLILEEIEAFDFEPRYNERNEEVPPEPEFVSGAQDEPAGRIAIYDDKQEHLIATAPIMRTDGPDRPFLVRTTDTSWHVPQHIVNMIYPEVEETFNQVDSQLPWGDLGLGSSGNYNNLMWIWENEDMEGELS